MADAADAADAAEIHCPSEAVGQRALKIRSLHRVTVTQWLLCLIPQRVLVNSLLWIPRFPKALTIHNLWICLRPQLLTMDKVMQC